MVALRSMFHFCLGLAQQVPRTGFNNDNAHHRDKR